MGEVWIGFDRETHQSVAIKTLLSRSARKADMRLRFEREADAVSLIQSPHVCALVDRGITGTGELFLVFELLSGESLAQKLKRETFLSFDETACILLDTLQGVHHAHLAKVLHRDIKPSNIFLQQTRTGQRAVVLDFGVAKILDPSKRRDESSLTALDDTLGSFSYMAPEQIRASARVDERADVYAVGTVGFLALTGHLPFEAVTARAVAEMKLHRQPPTLQSISGFEWPWQLEQFFASCLAKDPQQRIPSALAARQRVQQLDELIKNTRASRSINSST